jgi:hypothetical protein
MINLFKNIISFPVYLIVAFFGLSYAPCYATDDMIYDVAYYTFVMHKLDEEDLWKTVYESIRLSPGLYRFQVIIKYEAELEQWYALRGEFQFVKDTKGGVKLDNMQTLDLEDASSLWSKEADNWEQARDKHLKPLIERMNSLQRAGAPNPDFMRFLTLFQLPETFWLSDDDKSYRLFRLHYVNADLVSHKKYREAFSHFINPSQPVTTDIKQLKEWVNSQDSFSLASYLGEADRKHKDFYESFNTWFHPFFEIREASVPSAPPSNWGMLIFFGVLLLILIALAGMAFAFPDKWKQLRLWLRTRIESRNDSSLNDSEMAKTSYVSRKDLELLKKKIRQLHASVQNVEKREERQRDENSQANFEYVLKKEMKNVVLNILLENSATISKDVLQLYKNKEVKRVVNEQLQSIGKNFQDYVDQRLESHASKYWDQFIKEQQDKKMVVPDPIPEPEPVPDSTKQEKKEEKGEKVVQVPEPEPDSTKQEKSSVKSEKT